MMEYLTKLDETQEWSKGVEGQAENTGTFRSKCERNFEILNKNVALNFEILNILREFNIWGF